MNSTVPNHIRKIQRLIYKNPCFDLQAYLDIPIFKDKKLLFSPSLDTMKSAEDLFVPKGGHSIFLNSKTIDPAKFPALEIPEVAFMGQSNAGKSSVIKAIFRNAPDLAIKTSKKPGHTKSFQFFQVGSKLSLVDMPGYGLRQPEYFESVVQEYLRNRKNLIKTFVITDGSTGIDELDETTIQLLEQYSLPYSIIMTKIDMVRDPQRLKNFLHLQSVLKNYKLSTCLPLPFMLSSLTYEGLAYFLAFIGHITGNISLEA